MGLAAPGRDRFSSIDEIERVKAGAAILTVLARSTAGRDGVTLARISVAALAAAARQHAVCSLR
jgi:hypothetical protein